jgi:molecular chaperone Hsp33
MSAAGPPQGRSRERGETEARRARPQAWGGHAVCDALLPFVIDHAPVRGALIRLDATSRLILGQHAYPRALRGVLSELLAASALLASTLKLAGSLIVQWSGDGPVRLVVVECTDALDLRATAQWDDARVAALDPDASLAALSGGAAHARLTLSLDQRHTGTLYQGIVNLDAASVAASIEHYLAASEQLPSRLWLLPCGDAVTGLLLQRMPGAAATDDEHWLRLVDDANRGIASAAADASLAATLAQLFPHDDVRMFDARPVAFRCRCSAARVENALRIAGRAEIEAALAERGAVEVTCEFCNRRYGFGPAEARALFTRRPADTTGNRESSSS